MFGVERTRTLLGHADPARNADVGPPLVSARELIDSAGTAETVAVRRRVQPTRRLVLTAGTLAVAAGAWRSSSRSTGRAENSGGGGGLGARAGGVPVRRGSAGSRPAATHAGRQDQRCGVRPPARALHVPPHEGVGRSGDDVRRRPPPRGIRQRDEALAGHRRDRQPGQHPTGAAVPRPGVSGLLAARKHRTISSHRHPRTERHSAAAHGDQAAAGRPVRATAATEGRIRAGAASKGVSTLYGQYVVPRAIRAAVLRVLADVPGFRWRGQVTDRAGRQGVAVTFDDREHDAQSLLIFDPKTGELLADERLTLSPVRISSYKVILDAAWTDRAG